ncbi:putative tubulin--tyrosine ligase PBY1 [Leucoagaricus sp. SymC.cos]|nr:putative tubulin--tyrosine ligase PBY1 [Leucoagaricus sp. SymC.cos]
MSHLTECPSPRHTPGKAYHIKDITKGSYFYPQKNGQGETADTSRPLKDEELVGPISSQHAEWILLDGTPATCANIALHNLWPGQIDLVISGPNLGRNTSAAFTLSSGTIGAALSSSLSKIRSIALSYGTVAYPTPTSYHAPAHRLGCRVIEHLWHNWGEDQYGLRDGEVDLYSINIPLIEGLLSQEGLKVCWTNIWRNTYGRLFKNVSAEQSPEQAQSDVVITSGEKGEAKTTAVGPSPTEAGNLLFKWAPEMKSLITPTLSDLPVGSDGWAIYHGYVSVTPLRASFGEPHTHQSTEVENRFWKMRL